MKKRMRRLISFTLALFLVLSLLPTSALAEETAEQTTTEKGMAYFASETEQVLGEGRIEGSVTRKPVYAEKDNGYYTDVEEAIALLRERMVDRRSVIEIPLRVSKTDAASVGGLQALIEVIFAMAAAHTGVEDQGDYLLWSVAKRGYNATYTETNSYYYLDIPYEFTYYTTLEQEVSVGRKLDSIFASFGFTEQSDDYTKIKTIYDYICANVTYDYANLENDAYTLKYTAYAALNNGTAVCQGYATLLYRMLLRAGVDCRVITGVDDNNEPHAWNIVALDGIYYNLDSTWDAANSEYQYFLKGATDFPDHFRDASYDSADFHIFYPMAALGYNDGEPQVVAQGTCGEGVNWVLMSDGILTVSGNGAMEDYTQGPDAPWAAWKDYIQGVEVKSGVTHVGTHSFNDYNSLLAVSIDGAKTIGNGAFYSCDNLLAADILEGTEEIGEGAFRTCINMVAVSMPASLKRIGDYAFATCNALDAVVLADIGAWCSVSIAYSANPFYNGAAIYLNEELVTDLVIPGTVKVVAPDVFTNAEFTTLVISEGVEEIGHGAFAAINMHRTTTDITLPTTLKKVGASAFADNQGDVHISDLAAWCNIEFANDSSNPLYGEKLYINGELVDNLVIPEGVTEIKAFAFVGGKFTSVTLPDSVLSVGKEAFSSCDNLERVQLGKGVKTLGDKVFSRCKSLQVLKIPASVETMGSWILDQNYANIKEVHFEGNAPSFEHSTFYASYPTVYYPAGNPTWTEEVRQNYGGEITWVAACTAHSFENGVCTNCGEKDPDFKPDGLLGDADGSGVVDYVDAMLVLQYHTGVITNEALALGQCDVDGSGAVDYVDAMRILQYHTGVISGF